MWVSNAASPWEFRGAVNYVLEPWPDRESVEERCTTDAYEWHSENGLFQLMDMGVVRNISDIEDEIIDLLQRYGSPGEFVLAGRGVAIRERPLIEEWMPGVYEWFNDQLVLDITGISYTMGMAGLAEQLEPHYEPTGIRAMHDAQRSFLEFQHYTEVFKAVPLVEAPEYKE